MVNNVKILKNLLYSIFYRLRFSWAYLATTNEYDNIECADSIIEEKQKVLEKSITPKKI